MPGRRDLTLLATGQLISVSGDSAAMVALLLRLRPAGSGWVAALLAAELVPYIVFAPLSGRVVDRIETRRVLLFALFGQAVVAVPLALVTPAWATVALFAALYALATLVRPATSTLVPAIVGAAAASRGYARLSTGTGLGWIIGPALGGLIAGTVGIRTTLLLDAATFAALGAITLLIRARRPPATGAAEPSDGAGEWPGDRAGDGAGEWPGDRPGARPGDSAAVGAAVGGSPERSAVTAPGGLALVWRSPVLRIALFASAVATGCAVIDNVAAPFRFINQLHSSEFEYGLYLALWGIGGLAGVQLAGRLQPHQHARAIALGNGVMGLGIAGIGLAPALPVALVASTLGGIGNGLVNVVQSALVAAHTPDAQHGRAFAATGAIVQTAIGVGTAVAAPLVAGLGAGDAMAAAGSLATLAAVAGFIRSSTSSERDPSAVAG